MRTIFTRCRLIKMKKCFALHYALNITLAHQLKRISLRPQNEWNRSPKNDADDIPSFCFGRRQTYLLMFYQKESALSTGFKYPYSLLYKAVWHTTLQVFFRWSNRLFRSVIFKEYCQSFLHSVWKDDVFHSESSFECAEHVSPRPPLPCSFKSIHYFTVFAVYM